MRHPIRARSAAVLAALALAAAVPASGVQAEPASPQAVSAKRCSSGYVHAVLPSGHKCLRRGQLCATRYDRHYHRYGFHCHTGRLK